HLVGGQPFHRRDRRLHWGHLLQSHLQRERASAPSVCLTSTSSVCARVMRKVASCTKRLQSGCSRTSPRRRNWPPCAKPRGKSCGQPRSAATRTATSVAAAAAATAGCATTTTP